MKNNSLEILTVIFISVLFIIINISTATLLPPINCDEVMFTDPAVNLAWGQGFRTSMWYTQSYNSFYSSNAPLYSLILTLWITLTGFTPTAVRSLNYILYAISGIIIWRNIFNMNIIALPKNRIFLLIMILLGEGTSLAYRMGRYDSLGIFIIAISWFVCSVGQRKYRLPMLFGLGCALSISGYQNVVFATVLIFVGVILKWRNPIVDYTSFFAGILFGLFALMFVYVHYNSLDIFLRSLIWHSGAKITLYSRLVKIYRAITVDKSSLILIFILSFLTIGSRFKENLKINYSGYVGFSFLLVIPAILGFIGFFQDYYSWFKFIPAVICVFIFVENIMLNYNIQYVNRAITVMVVLACLFFPMRLALAIVDYDLWDYNKLTNFVTSNILPKDRVVISLEAYYPVKRTAEMVYASSNIEMLNDDEMGKITLLVAKESEIERLIEKLGGRWSKISEYNYKDTKSVTERLGIHVGWPKYDLQIYRKN